ncbi:M43 family zinc metalloprotease [Hymenobacter properus]|uniref:T9SS type A sorting domain-containing protein n=1 Tax=Hymenobacter properus TaxID=2791026 RepID=A0A931BCT6_9BACT|nr:M43 family zinc metalloprotease [Hymenobacter properus]MBF9140241.1 T9SS type A sorting domain-containing protein [Hymenobacter properus]MBR7719048.1 T9SS type A sorting domain-containing protein [Microvirga sp. SRT04]
MKRVLPSALAALLTLSGLGASAQAPAGILPNWCGTTAEQNRYFAEHPGAREAQKQFNERMEALSKAQTQGVQQRNNYVTDITIPVVVHIIHTGGTDNISDRQINSAIDQLNLDYQKLNPDTADIAPLFRPIAAAVGFRFRLAKKDPNGNCTTGITRHYAPSIATDDGSGAVQAISNWDRSRYMNIWVVRGIASGAAGYVSPPNTPTNVRDGFTVLSTYFGTQGTGSLYVGRAATHEIGHYLGLSHTWGATNNPGTGNCTGTDNIPDTPQTDGIYSNCNLNYAPCGPIANVQNFMDYSYCFRMFTQGQRTYMRNVLAANRSVLTSQANLVFTGTNDGYVAPDCAPIAAFSVAPGTSGNVCINTPVTLRDFSTNFTPTGGTLTYSWSFPGGTPATATGQQVTVSYPAAGFYSVTETVTNSVGSSTSTQTNIIRVEGPTGGETAPLTQSFEDVNFPNIYATPTLRNYETSGTTAAGAAGAFVWRRQAAVPAADGSAYLTVTNRTYPASAITTLVTPNINLSGLTNATLRFDRAYALRSSTDNTQLRISFSSDCGQSWQTPTTLTGATLTTQGLTPIDGYVPASSTEWQTLSVAIPAQFQGSGLFKVRLQMVNGSAQGNTFFLDNMRVTTALAAKADAGAARGIAVYPNPLTKETAVHLALDKAASVQVSLTDVLGRPVLTLPAKAYGAGPQVLPLSPAGRPLQAGVYLVRVSLDGQTFTSKLTVE